MSRREFVGACAAATVGLSQTAFAEPPASGNVRNYHLSVSEDALNADPELLNLVKEAGVTSVWLTGYLYGYWHYKLEESRKWAERVQKAGMTPYLINVPLGHPGDSLGAMAGDVPLSPPKHWKLGTRPDGTHYSGTSLHPPATEENAAALKLIAQAGYKRVFLDDDFRLAQSPGIIGGCYCDDHKRRFLQLHGYNDERWNELLDAVAKRRLNPILDAWISFTCDDLTRSFRAQQNAAQQLRLGIMVMYLGSEKAGIRLQDYRNSLFRVGELMFDDGSFGAVKGKTNELFSALFHRRYARPELAYSETTAYPSDRLSAANMAAKLTVSTISDVRNTMYMSGLTAFPRTHWQTLGSAMKKQAAIHQRVAGHKPRGPFKHWWGDKSRKVGDDNPFSLFLASGVPFEVVDRPSADGWTFLSDYDARSEAESTEHAGTVYISRPQAGANIAGGRAVAETMEAIYALKHEIMPKLANTPHVEDDVPVVCAWYPSAGAVVLWNLSEERKSVTLKTAKGRKGVEMDGLGSELVDV